MTSKEKADEIYVGFWYLTNDSRIAKNCALVAVDEIIEELSFMWCHYYGFENQLDERQLYWHQVREEIEKL